MPGDTYFKLFRVMFSTERTDYVVTNNLNLTHQSADGAEEKGAVRWTVEQFHREEKQITVIERCQCRSGRSHIGIAVLVWTRLKNLAYRTRKTVCQLKHGQLDDYLLHQMANLTIAFA